MGKIFDALGKTDSDSPSDDDSRSKENIGNGDGKKIPTTTNVVPFANRAQLLTDTGFDENLIAFHQPHSLESEMFKVLRTNILFPSKGRPPRSIMVTSAMPGDGKSFVSTNLSVCMAQSVEEHVLLMDADIRNPSVDQIFGLGKVKGLSEYLSEGASVADHLIRTPVNKLTILPAGEIPYNPTELLTTQKMKVLLDEVKNRYEDRYIIVDTAPPLLASETAAISKYMDGILVVVKADVTPKKAIDEVIEQLGKEKIIGFVLNYSDQSQKKYYGYGKSYFQKQ